MKKSGNLLCWRFGRGLSSESGGDRFDPVGASCSFFSGVNEESCLDSGGDDNDADSRLSLSELALELDDLPGEAGMSRVLCVNKCCFILPCKRSDEVNRSSK